MVMVVMYAMESGVLRIAYDPESLTVGRWSEHNSAVFDLIAHQMDLGALVVFKAS